MRAFFAMALSLICAVLGLSMSIYGDYNPPPGPSNGSNAMLNLGAVLVICGLIGIFVTMLFWNDMKDKRR